MHPVAHQKKYDMLRGFSSITVLVAHVMQTFIYRITGPENVIVIANGVMARYAVLVFFLLSGYLITQSIMANIRRSSRFDAFDYLAARIARIYPPLVGAIAIVLLVSAFVHGLNLPGSDVYGLPGDVYAVRERFSVTIKDVLLAILMSNGMLQADGPLWTLYIEFHIYIIALFVSIAITSASIPKRLVALVLTAALFVFWAILDNQFVFFLLVWAIGSGLSIWRVRFEQQPLRGLFAKLAYLVFAIHLVLLIFKPEVLAIGKPTILVSYGIQLAACVSFAYAIFISAGSKTWLHNKCPTRMLVKSGDFSYSLYIIHFPLLLLILSITQAWMGDSITRACAVSLVSIVIVMTVSRIFSEYFEDQQRFKPKILAAINFILKSE